MNAGTPYRVYGGLRFFERAEIKDALAYLRLIANRADDASFERVVNTPTRGIGARSVDAIRVYARANTCSLWQAAGALVSDGLNARAANAVLAFLNLIEMLDRDTRDLATLRTGGSRHAASGLIDHYKKGRSESAETKVENLEELVSAARGYLADESEDMPARCRFCRTPHSRPAKGRPTPGRTVCSS